MDVDVAIGIINNWRASHQYPLNTLQMRLRKKANQVDSRSPVVSQRIKRLPAIESKLRRLRRVSLAIMQDIGGCRAVVGTVPLAYQLRNAYRRGRIRHELERESDYILAPTEDGYRSLHLVYRYYSDTNKKYDGQRIEVQIRSRLQHAWATAIEAADACIPSLLKVNQGDPLWARFFALMGTAIAMREKTQIVPGTPTRHRQIVTDVRELAQELNVRDRLLAIRATGNFQRRVRQDDHFYLLDLDMNKRQMTISTYKKSQVEAASLRLAELEIEYRNNPAKDALLVSVRSVRELQRAYASYYANTDIFLEELARTLQ